jgi:threonine aldolase
LNKKGFEVTNIKKFEDNDSVVFRGDGEPRTTNNLLLRLNEFANKNQIEDDDFSLGGIVSQLETEMASRLGKQAAIFIPSGTLANHLAIRKHAATQGRAVVQEQSHIFNDTGDSIQRLSGINLVPLAQNRVYFDANELNKAYITSVTGRVLNPISVVSIETPVRRQHGQVVPWEHLVELTKFCKTNKIPCHLDGARIFMQAAVTGRSVEEYASLFDSVYVSLYKYLGTPFGSILAGEKDFIEGMYHERRMFGGGLANVSLIAALALNGLERFEHEFPESINKALQLFPSLNELEHIEIQSFEHGSNIFRLILSEGICVDSFIRNLKSVRIFVYTEPSNEIYLHVNATILKRPNHEIISAFSDAISKSVKK